jgi:hypothetical protein
MPESSKQFIIIIDLFQLAFNFDVHSSDGRVEGDDVPPKELMEVPDYDGKPLTRCSSLKNDNRSHNGL